MDAFWQWLGSGSSQLPLLPTKANRVNENNNATVSFDRMRNMMVRAAEIRESEQQQIFDALDEIHARLTPLDSIGSVRKRLSELPDRTEVGVLAERLDEAVSKLEAQDAAIASVARAVESIVDKLATPFAQLDGRLDGVVGKMEGVAGRMDGLEDKLANIHRRLDSLDTHLDKQDSKLDVLPSAVHGPVRERIELMENGIRGRIDEFDSAVQGHVAATRDTLARAVTESTEAVRATVGERADSLHGKLDAGATELTGTREALTVAITQSRDAVHGKVDAARDALRTAVDETRDTVDGTERLTALAERLEQVTGRLDGLTTRLDTVEDGFTARLGDLGGSIEQSLAKVDATLTSRPDADSVASMMRRSNDDSVRIIGGHLDEAMATFAELMLGGGAPPPPPPPTTLPRQSRRRNPGSKAKAEKSTREDEDTDLAAG